MPGIKQPIVDVMTRISSQISDFKTIRIWNNQVRHNAEGQYPDYPKPACFVQVLSSVDFEALPGSVASADLGFVFHIVHEYYDANDGTFEQDLPVFDLRDKVLEAFTLFKPSGCGPMTLVTDTQDDDHTNIYEYQVGFVCHFLDNTAVPATQTKQPPTDIQITATFAPPKNYIIPNP